MRRCRRRRASSARASPDGETLDDLLPEAFAVVREAIRRRARPARLRRAAPRARWSLHQGKIAELKTGEGKTLVASLAMYLNALEGRGVHLVTVNDYLAKRDAQWYGRVLAWLGLSVGVLQHDSSYMVSVEPVSEEPGSEYMTPCSRRDAYAADVTYGTNHEFGFDYLRDNMATRTGPTRCSASATSPSSTRSTTSSSTRRARR